MGEGRSRTEADSFIIPSAAHLDLGHMILDLLDLLLKVLLMRLFGTWRIARIESSPEEIEEWWYRSSCLDPHLDSDRQLGGGGQCTP